MVFSNETIRQGSTAVRLWEAINNRYAMWADQSQAVVLLRELFADQSAETDAFETSGRTGGTDSEFDASAESSSSSSVEADRTISVPDTGPRSTSVVYRSGIRLRRFVETSWLYRWLTAEPDSEVIVIDLRETLSAGPVLAQIDQRIRDFIAVMPTSGGLRGGFRLRRRFVSRPIRVVSIGVIIIVLAVLFWLAASSESVGLSTFVLLAVLLIAARGTQSNRSWDELTATGWYQLLSAAVESSELLTPPEPPEQPRTDSSPETTDDQTTSRQ